MIDMTKPAADRDFWAALNTPLRAPAEPAYPIAVEGHDQWGAKMPDYHRERLNSAWERARAAKIMQRRRMAALVRFMAPAALLMALLAAFAFLPTVLS